MHIAQLDSIHSGNEDDSELRTDLDEHHAEMDGSGDDEYGDDVCDEEYDEGYGDDDKHDILQCPFNGCKRNRSFTDRSNLIRHFQQRTCIIVLHLPELNNDRCGMQ
jgi:hypothetical protein